MLSLVDHICLIIFWSPPTSRESDNSWQISVWALCIIGDDEPLISRQCISPYFDQHTNNSGVVGTTLLSFVIDKAHQELIFGSSVHSIHRQLQIHCSHLFFCPIVPQPCTEQWKCVVAHQWNSNRSCSSSSLLSFFSPHDASSSTTFYSPIFPFFSIPLNPFQWRGQGRGKSKE